MRRPQGPLPERRSTKGLARPARQTALALGPPPRRGSGRRLLAGLLLAALPVLPALVAPAALAAPAASAGLDARALARELKQLSRAHSRLMHLEPLCSSTAGREVWRVELGTGTAEERAERPALLVVGGLEQHDPVATAASLELIRRLVAGHAEDPQRLDSTTVHVIPRLNPDAAASAFASPRFETPRSTLPVDDDHDGLLDEDGPEDLDGDGLITWMKVEDPEGSHVEDPKEPRLLVAAEAARGEVGRYRFLPEGRDDDADERFNEDGVGGVNFNRNFSQGYAWFATDAGRHQVSETETRALADFVVARPNVGLVVCYGSGENLEGAPKGAPGRTGRGGEAEAAGPRRRGPRKPPSAADEEDLAYLKRLGEGYRELLGLEKPATAVTHPGSFADWMYFHRGRLALATRSFTPERQTAIDAAAKKRDEKQQDEKPRDENDAKEAASAHDDGAEGSADLLEDAGAAASEDASAGREDPSDDASEGDEPADTERALTGRRGRGGRDGGPGGRRGEDDDAKRNAEDRALLKWLDEQHPAAFIPWTPFDHPDFPGRSSWIGGFAPFARSAPPPGRVAELAAGQADWLLTLTGKLPRVALRRVEAKHLGRGVFELLIQVENRGYLPTVLAHGAVTGEVHPTRLIIDLPDEAFLAGARRTMLEPLAGSGGMQELRFVVLAPGRRRVPVEVISALGGRARASLSLEGGR